MEKVKFLQLEGSVVQCKKTKRKGVILSLQQQTVRAVIVKWLDTEEKDVILVKNLNFCDYKGDPIEESIDNYRNPFEQ